MQPLAVTNQRRIIPPLLGERAGVRVGSLLPRHEALTKRFIYFVHAMLRKIELVFT
jgi:hypothetical protein